jgi:hypothetical protein
MAQALKLPASHCGSSGSIPGQFRWNLWWTKWHWKRGFPDYLRFPLPVPFHGSSIFITTYVLLGQTGEAWAPCKEQCAFGNREALVRRVLSIFILQTFNPVVGFTSWTRHQNNSTSKTIHLSTPVSISLTTSCCGFSRCMTGKTLGWILNYVS